MSINDRKHGQRERLIFLDRCFTWRGRANRRDLTDRFGISTAQAALDFKAYLAESGERTPSYDAVKKVYVAHPDHTPLVPDATLGEWESILRENGSPRFGELPSLTRRSDPVALARMSRAMENKKAIQIRYTSMSTGDRSPQWIAPVSFASDGARIHLRAYSFKHKDYRDYVPGRIDPRSSFRTRPLKETLPVDHDWHTIACITLAPQPALTDEQADAVRHEYGFDGEHLIVETRKALEFYADRRWGLDQPNARLERIRTEYIQCEHEALKSKL